MIEIDKTLHPWIIKWMYDDVHIHHYGQFPIGIRFHLGIIDNHTEIRKIFNSANEKFTDNLTGHIWMTEDLKKIRKKGALLYENNEAFDFENCSPFIQKSLKNDHWKYLRTNTWWGERCRTVFGHQVHTYIPEENHSKVLFWNWVYQEWVLKFRVKTKLPTSTLNPDDVVEVITFEHEGMEREVRICLSTQDEYRNHAEALDGAKIFIKPKELNPRVLYK